MRVPKESPDKLLNSVGVGARALQKLNPAARIRAFRARMMNRLRGWKQGTDETRMETLHHGGFRNEVLADVSGFLVFRLKCVGPASASVSARAA